MKNEEHGLTPDQMNEIVRKIEADYSDLHIQDWYEICQILLARADV